MKYFAWRRTKKRGARGMTMIPVSKKVIAFAEDFLRELPARRQAYNDILRTLQREVLRRHPKLINIKPLCPLKCRHSFAVNRLREGLSAQELRQVLNCSPAVLDFYVKMTPESLGKRLREVGFA
jgi:hypothetical protein